MEITEEHLMAESPAVASIQDTLKQYCNEEEIIKKEEDGQTTSVQIVKVESHVCEISHTIVELTEEKIKPPPHSLVEEKVRSSENQEELRPEASLPEDRIKPPPYNNRIDIETQGDGNDVLKPESESNVEQLGFCQTSTETCQLKRKSDFISSLSTSSTTSGSTDMLGPKEAKKPKIEKKVYYNCTLCKVTVHSEFTWLGHLNGKRHQCVLKRLAKLNKDKQVSSDTENKSTVLGTRLVPVKVKVKMDNEDSLAAKPTREEELPIDERIANKMQVGHKEQPPAPSLAEERWQHLIMNYGASSTADLSTSSMPALATSSLPALGESSSTAPIASSMLASRPTQYASLGEYFRSTLGTSKKPLTTFFGVQLESWPVGSSFSGQKLAFSRLGPAPSQSTTLFGSSFQQTQSASGSIIFGSTPAHSASSAPATGSSSTPAPDTSRMLSPRDPSTSSAPSAGATSMPSPDASSMPTFDSTLGRRSSPIGDDISTFARIVDYRWQSKEPVANHNLFGPYQPHRDPFVDREHEREIIQEEVRSRIIEEEVRRELEIGVYYGLQHPNLGYQGTWPAEQFKRPRFSDGFYARRRGPRFRAPCKRFEGRQWSWVREVQHTVTRRNEGELMAKSPVALIEDKVNQCIKEEELNKDAEAWQLKRKGGSIPVVSTPATTSSSTDVLCPKNAKKPKIEQTVYYCTLCQVTVGGEGCLLSHLNGNRHQNALERLAKLDINKQVNSDTQYKCTLNWTQL